MKKEKPKFRLPRPDEVNEPPKNILQYCITIFGEKGVGKTSRSEEHTSELQSH